MNEIMRNDMISVYLQSIGGGFSLQVIGIERTACLLKGFGIEAQRRERVLQIITLSGLEKKRVS